MGEHATSEHFDDAQSPYNPNTSRVTMAMIRDLVSQPYDPQHLLQLELSRKALNLSASVRMDLTNNAAYAQAFFEHANIWYACVNPYNWHTYYRIAMSYGFRVGPESCITLLVRALGAASLGGKHITSAKGQGTARDGLLLSFLAVDSHADDAQRYLSAQCLILASAYLLYLVRPMEAWNLLSNTSMKPQLLLSRQDRILGHSKELSERVY